MLWDTNVSATGCCYKPLCPCSVAESEFPELGLDKKIKNNMFRKVMAKRGRLEAERC